VPEQACKLQPWRGACHQDASGAPTGAFDGHAEHGFSKSLVRATEASKAAIAEMAECLVETADRVIDVSEELEVLARGVGR
jgi:hypothetical protein